jgi:hypothetical protein
MQNIVKHVALYKMFVYPGQVVYSATHKICVYQHNTYLWGAYATRYWNRYHSIYPLNDISSINDIFASRVDCHSHYCEFDIAADMVYLSHNSTVLNIIKNKDQM